MCNFKFSLYTGWLLKSSMIPSVMWRHRSSMSAPLRIGKHSSDVAWRVTPPCVQASVTMPAMVLLGEIAPQTEVPPAVDVTVDLLPVDVSCTSCQLLWTKRFAAALPDMSPRPAAELTASGPRGACMTQLTQQTNPTTFDSEAYCYSSHGTAAESLLLVMGIEGRSTDEGIFLVCRDGSRA